LAEFVELQIESGATFSTEITVTESGSGSPKDLADFTARSQLRKSYYSTSATSFNVSVTDAANGVITMSLPAADTANLRAGRYVYDVEIENSQNTVIRIFEGIITVIPNVTR
jgi:hypothetical protein